MNSHISFSTIVFLDTNVLHYIILYLNYAKDHDIFPWPLEDIQTISSYNEHIAKNTQDDINNSCKLNNEIKESLNKGLEVLKCIYKERDDIQVHYAPLSEIELLIGRTRGHAIVSAAKEGIPDRMFSRFNEQHIQDRIDSESLINIKGRIDDSFCILKDLDFIIEVNLAGRIKDVFELTKYISGLVYMEAIDCTIYASSILAEADYLITSDGYFRKVINRINSRSGEYKDIYCKIIEYARNMISMGDKIDLTLPHGCNIKDMMSRIDNHSTNSSV